MQNWRLKGLFIGAYTNLTTMRCSGSSRSGVIFRDKISTYVFCCWCKIFIASPSEFIFYTTNMYAQRNIYWKEIKSFVRLLYFVGIRSVL